MILFLNGFIIAKTHTYQVRPLPCLAIPCTVRPAEGVHADEEDSDDGHDDGHDDGNGDDDDGIFG